MGIFKAYDIRGRFGETLTLDIAHRIGRCLPQIVPAQRVLIGRDARASSPALAEALGRGLAEAGCDVDDAGHATTPMVYYLTARHGYDLSVQVTASHNPAGDNGFKVSRRGARPVGYATGLDRLEEFVNSGRLPPPAATPGRRQSIERLEEFIEFLSPWRPDLGGLRLAVDCSDGMAALVARPLLGEGPRYLADKPDGAFPSHSPNPMIPEGHGPLAEYVRRERMDAGVIFDGDVDRVMFIDEQGRFVRPDLMIAPIAARFLRREPGATVLQDIRTSRAVTEELVRLGAQPAMWKVGHAFAKEKMRELNAICGGELAGHYYFRDFFWCDSGELAAMVALGELAAAHRRGLRFSEWLAPLECYANSGELNYRLARKAEAMEHVRRQLTAEREPLALLDFDGYRIEYADWWVNIRLSNTEPYLRLVIEASDAAHLQARREQIEKLLEPYAEEA